MRIVFEFEDSEIKKNQHFFDELYKLIKNASVKLETAKKPEHNNLELEDDEEVFSGLLEEDDDFGFCLLEDEKDEEEAQEKISEVKVASPEKRRKVGKKTIEKIDGSIWYYQFPEKFAEIAKNTDYHLGMSIEDALSGLSEQLMDKITSLMKDEWHWSNKVKYSDCNFGEFTNRFRFTTYDGSFSNIEMAAELVLKLESIVKKLWTDDIGVLTIKDMVTFGGWSKRIFDKYGIKDFRSPEDLHDMFVGTACSLSPTRANALLRVIYNLMIKK